MHSTLQFNRQNPPPQWLITFVNDLLWRKKIAFPLKVFPTLPLWLLSVCAALCTFLVSLHTVSPHSCVCIHSPFVLFCSVSLSFCFFLLFSFPLLSFSHSLTHQGYWGIGRQPKGWICWRWLALLACQWGVKRLPRCCNSSLRATLALCTSTHKHTVSHNMLQIDTSSWQMHSPTQIKNTTEYTGGYGCIETRTPRLVLSSVRVKTHIHTCTHTKKCSCDASRACRWESTIIHSILVMGRQMAGCSVASA